MKKHKRAPMLTMICPVCDKKFQREKWKQTSSHSGTYCSSKCYEARSPQVEVECMCGTKFKAYQSRLAYYHRVFCSQECYMKHGFHGRLTDDIPEVSNYGKFVAKLRSTAKYLSWSEQCRQRDYNRCIDCGAEDNLTVHHIVSVYDFVKKHGLDQTKIQDDDLFFDPNNGETLCRSCHLHRHKELNDE